MPVVPINDSGIEAGEYRKTYVPEQSFGVVVGLRVGAFEPGSLFELGFP